jgi:hypothetical protein
MKRICVVLLLCLSCKPQPGVPPVGVPGVINCAVDEVKAKWPEVLPKVNRCLTDVATGNWFDCLVGLVGPVSETVVACVVDSSGQSYADAGSHGDKLSAMASARATEFIKQRGYRFAP